MPASMDAPILAKGILVAKAMKKQAPIRDINA
jgi:hypothetical protein